MLWHCTVTEAKSRCTMREFYEWQAWYELHPWGEERADLRAGIIASTICNIYRKRGSRRLKPSDFMPKFGKKVKQTTQEMFNKLKAVADMHKVMFGGKKSPPS